MKRTRTTVLAVLAVGVAIYASWFQNRPVVVKPATHEDAGLLKTDNALNLWLTENPGFSGRRGSDVGETINMK